MGVNSETPAPADITDNTSVVVNITGAFNVTVTAASAANGAPDIPVDATSAGSAHRSFVSLW